MIIYRFTQVLQLPFDDAELPEPSASCDSYSSLHASEALFFINLYFLF
jgi:hypothetical protein